METLQAPCSCELLPRGRRLVQKTMGGTASRLQSLPWRKRRSMGESDSTNPKLFERITCRIHQYSIGRLKQSSAARFIVWNPIFPTDSCHQRLSASKRGRIQDVMPHRLKTSRISDLFCRNLQSSVRTVKPLNDDTVVSQCSTQAKTHTRPVRRNCGVGESLRR